MRLVELEGEGLADVLDDLARLRIDVFRDWPYLYDGSLAYERDYLASYVHSDRAIVLGVYDGDWLVGASTGSPLQDHSEDFSDAFAATDIDVSKVFYCGESVLLKPYRGRGLGHRFFDLREAHARKLGFKIICFCAVKRPLDHPLLPPLYRPLEPFWEARGYRPMPGIVAGFSWKDVDQAMETEKPLQFWFRTL